MISYGSSRRRSKEARFNDSWYSEQQEAREKFEKIKEGMYKYDRIPKRGNMWIPKCRIGRSVSALWANWEESNEEGINEEEGNETAKL